MLIAELVMNLIVFQDCIVYSSSLESALVHFTIFSVFRNGEHCILVWGGLEDNKCTLYHVDYVQNRGGLGVPCGARNHYGSRLLCHGLHNQHL